MSVLKFSGRHRGKFIGGYFPLPIYNYLCLYSLAKDVSKTDVIEDAIVKWMKEQQKSDTEESLLHTLVYHINAGWQVSRVTKPEMSFEAYCKEVKTELIDKGLTDIQAGNIINRLKY